jgi:hypothetical protein
VCRVLGGRSYEDDDGECGEQRERLSGAAQGLENWLAPQAYDAEGREECQTQGKADARR